MVFDVAAEDHGAWLIVRVVGDLDLANNPSFRVALVAAALRAADDGRPLAVDLTHCDFIDSGGLGILLGGLRRQLDAEATFALVATGSARRLLARLRLDEVLTVVDDRAALEGLG